VAIDIHSPAENELPPATVDTVRQSKAWSKVTKQHELYIADDIKFVGFTVW